MDIYQTVTNQIIESIETSNTLPWLKPWKDSKGAVMLSMPHNFKANTNYNGINILLLWLAQDTGGYTSNSWLTYNQAKGLDGQVRKGEKGTKIVFYKNVAAKENAAGEVKDGYRMARAFTVFNVDQIDGIEPPALPVAMPIADKPFMLDVCDSVGAEVRHGGNQAYFIPSQDHIAMPLFDQFDSMDKYNAVVAHELTHWTGHKSRLDRNFDRFEKSAVAMEELTAELGSAFISAELGFNLSEMRHDSYIEGWLTALKDNKRAIFQAASAASKAHTFIKDAVLAEVA